jgi:hypothetical protein
VAAVIDIVGSPIFGRPSRALLFGSRHLGFLQLSDPYFKWRCFAVGNLIS